MPKVRIRTPIFRILRLSAPHVNSVIGEFVAAKSIASDGGSKITLDELQQIGVEIGFRVGSVVSKELLGANSDIIDVEIDD